MSDHSERLDEAIRQALASRGGSLPTIARGYHSGLTASGYLKVCPFCGDKGQTFAIKRSNAGHWYWGCNRPQCPVSFDNLKSNRTADTLGFLMVHDGIDRHAAIDKLLSLAGVPNPRQDLPLRKRTARQQEPKDQASLPPASVDSPLADPSPEESATAVASDTLFAMPEDLPPPAPENVVTFSLKGEPEQPAAKELTVWDDLWGRLQLSSEDRELLKRKRGYQRETIETLGFRSSGKLNRSLLQPILVNHPEAVLLSEGIAIRDSRTGELKVNAQLCGYGLKKRGETTEDDEWAWTDPILIPYFSPDGRVLGIRPHKGGLSGKRYMQEQGFELGFRSKRTRVKPYITPLVWNPPTAWEGRVVLTEGEFKAGALYQCRIPAAATPGIQMLRNDPFLEELVDRLRLAGTREVIVCYDNEDKSHKPDPWSRYDADVYALYACHVLRTKGFVTRHLTLPDEWRVEGKADWDGALAKFGSRAPELFAEVLKGAKRYHPQEELFGMSERQRITHCKLRRLLLNPSILTGGDDEEEMARLILKTPMPYRAALGISSIADELFATRGCYYSRKPRARKDLKHELNLLAKIEEEILETPEADLKTRAGLDAARAAVQHVIDGRIEILTDFVISCEFQIRKADGSVERLFQLRNKYGEKSQVLSVPSSAWSTSSRFREFVGSRGNYNPTIGDKQLQLLMVDLGHHSAWREIRELEMIGMDSESGLWIFGDCAVAKDGTILFADHHDVIWYDGVGYRIDPEDLKEFAHREPPKFFQRLGKEPWDVLAEIKADEEKEEYEVMILLFQLAADLIATFGDSSGLLALGAVLAYAMSPELLRKCNGHPGLWIHGRAFAGKTETVRFLMQLWGYDPAYKAQSLSSGTTAVGIDRVLAQYSCIPMHLDEFRQDEADKTRIASLRLPFNRQAKSKGKLDQSNKTRSVQPMTSPIVTGEGVTNDSATLSRYVECILSSDRRLGSKAEQRARYSRMLAQSKGYHRIVRWILMRRQWFAREGIKCLEDFFTDPEVARSITSDRLQISYGTAYAAYSTLIGHFVERATALADPQKGRVISEAVSTKDLQLMSSHSKALREFTLHYAQNAAADVASINFVIKFWTDVMTFYQRESTVRKFIWFEWCEIGPTNKVTRVASKQDGPGLVRCVLVNANPLYAEYEQDARKRGHQPELSLSNIRAECQAERFWVPSPKDSKNRSHRMTISKDVGQISVWILRCDRMEPSLAAVFADRFEIEEEEQRLAI